MSLDGQIFEALRIGAFIMAPMVLAAVLVALSWWV